MPIYKSAWTKFEPKTTYTSSEHETIWMQEELKTTRMSTRDLTVEACTQPG